MVTSYNQKDMVSFAKFINEWKEKGMLEVDSSGNPIITNKHVESWKLKKPYLLKVKNETRGIEVNLYQKSEVAEFFDCIDKGVQFECGGMILTLIDSTGDLDEDWEWLKGEHCGIHVPPIWKPRER